MGREWVIKYKVITEGSVLEGTDHDRGQPEQLPIHFLLIKPQPFLFVEDQAYVPIPQLPPVFPIEIFVNEILEIVG